MIVSTGTLAHVASNTLEAGGQLRVVVALFNTKQDSEECQGCYFAQIYCYTILVPDLAFCNPLIIL